MNKWAKEILYISVLMSLFICCTDERDNPLNCPDNDFFCEYESRGFDMGFTSWAYAPTVESVSDSYLFIGNNADIYTEHIDSNIPWNAWINDLPLPAEFTNEISARAARKIPNLKLTVSVSLLDLARAELAEDFDGAVPDYVSLDDKHIEDAYFKHLKYITDQLNPDYLLVSIEINELLMNAPAKWEGCKLLMANIRSRMRSEFPSLPISESITLHNFYEPGVVDTQDFQNEIANYINELDYAAISFYPYFKNLKTKDDFQKAFDFLHDKVSTKIAFAETGHLSEDLTVTSFDLFISGSQSEQNDYLQTLLLNAQQLDYEYIIWYAHRDYDELWEIFPDDVKDLGKLWISTGIINEDGAEKESYNAWKTVFNK